MKRGLAILVVSMIVLALLASGISCTKTVYITTTPTPTPTQKPTLTESEIIANVLNTNPVHSLLSEEKSIFEEYSYVESTKVTAPYQEYQKYWNQKCSLRVRAVNNRDELTQITPPPVLADFWSMLVKSESSNCNLLSSCGALPMFCLATTSCVGTGGPPAPLADWMRQEAVEKNMEAWLALSTICREHGLDMPWSLPVVYH